MNICPVWTLESRPVTCSSVLKKAGDYSWPVTPVYDNYYIHSVLHRLVWVAIMSHVSFAFLQLSLSDRIVLSQSSPLDRRPMFVLVSLFLVCLPVFLLLFSAEYHNVLMCFSLWILYSLWWYYCENPRTNIIYYTSLCRPTLEYGSVAWDPHQASRIQKLESVQNKGAQYVTQEWSRYSSISDIIDKLGRCTLQQRRYVNMLSFSSKVWTTFTDTLYQHICDKTKTSFKEPSHILVPHTKSQDKCVSTLLPAPHCQSVEHFTPRSWDEIVLASPESFRAQLVNKLRSNQITLATSSVTIGPRPYFLRCVMKFLVWFLSFLGNA